MDGLEGKGEKMRTCEHLIQKKEAQYQENDVRIWQVLRAMTVREIALSPVGIIAKEAGIGRNTLYKHRTAYQYIVDCRIKENERLKKIEEKMNLQK